MTREDSRSHLTREIISASLEFSMGKVTMADEKRGRDREAESFEPGRRVEVDARLGQLYETRDAATGTPGLTLVPKGDVDWKPEGACRMHLTYEPTRESVTVDVEEAHASVRTSELTNLLVLMTAVFQRVEDDARVEAHLSSGLLRRPGREGSRRRYRGPLFWGGLAAGGAAMLAVGVGVWFGATCGVESSDPFEVGEATESHPVWDMDFVSRGETDLVAASVPMPDKPVPKQAVAPCETHNGEVEINKGCWMALDKRPPCGSRQVEYQGKCYLPVRKEDPLPQSVKP